MPSFHNSLSGVTRTYLVACHSRLIAEPQNRCQGTSDLLGCLMFWWDRELDYWRNWDQERSRKQVHVNQPIVATVHGNGNITNIGDNNGGTIVSSKRDKEEEDERNQTKRVRFHEEKPPPKKKTSGKRGDILPDGTKLEKATPLKLIASDNDNSSQDDDDSSKVYESDHEDGYNNDEEDVPLPEGVSRFRRNVGEIVTENISANAVEIKKKKRLSAIEKATLRYGASRIIDLSAHMKEWFSLEDRRFMMNDYMSLLHVPGLKDEESSFVTTIENMVNEKRINEAYEFCVQKLTSSDVNSYVRKISKIYLDFIYRSEDGDILDSAHTEIDVILKACSYIVEGLRKSLVVKQRWGESFCPLSKNADYKKDRKCDVRFLSPSGVDLGEWEFASNLTSHKAIGDRCRSARINQSILNGLLNRNLTNVEVKKINMPFLQIAGTSGQMLIEDLIEGFYVVFPGPKFELPTKLQHIGKLKFSVNIIKFVMDIYEQISEMMETKESTSSEFDSIFGSDDLDMSKLAHCKAELIHESWWTPKSNKTKVITNEQEASPTKDISPFSACSEFPVISQPEAGSCQSSASTIETYSDEENDIGSVDPNLVQNVISFETDLDNTPNR
ncbi:4282_t:CDS:10 [Ambispora leptoticha]|uniref:4282_t:CDS:1 n=1 Tax=Ambispora leptoticha TaxID=144679 RepID=A0A9N9BPE9_9GLOM|nr:4282_t:CDS:10 [Ambispora leptoticha]